MPKAKTDAKSKKVKEVEKVEEVSVHEARAERAGGEVLVFRDRFEAFRHFGVGSMEQLAEKLGKVYHGGSLEELLNG